MAAAAAADPTAGLCRPAGGRSSGAGAAERSYSRSRSQGGLFTMLLRLARRRLALPAFCSHRPHSTATPRNARHDDAEWATRRSVSDYRQRFRVRESAARKNVDDTVAQWLALSRTEQPLTSRR